jgi:hypothetical protein
MQLLIIYLFKINKLKIKLMLTNFQVYQTYQDISKEKLLWNIYNNVHQNLSQISNEIIDEIEMFFVYSNFSLIC